MWASGRFQQQQQQFSAASCLTPGTRPPLLLPRPHKQLVDDMRKRPYDLLDYSRTQLERDLLEFSVQINDLAAALQVGLGGWVGGQIRRVGAWVRAAAGPDGPGICAGPYARRPP